MPYQDENVCANMDARTPPAPATSYQLPLTASRCITAAPTALFRCITAAHAAALQALCRGVTAALSESVPWITNAHAASYRHSTARVQLLYMVMNRIIIRITNE